MAIDLMNLQPFYVKRDLSDKIFLFYGGIGTRKTSVSCRFPKPLLLACERGYNFINNVHVVDITSWRDIKEVLKQAKKQEVKGKFQTIIFDTIRIAYNLCYNYILNTYSVQDPGDLGYGRGWRLIREEFEKVILDFTKAGYAVVFIAHEDELAESSKEVKMDIDKRPGAVIRSLSDIVLYCKKELKDGTEDKVSVYAYSENINAECKTRAMYFPERIEFTYENLEAALKQAIETQLDMDNITEDMIEKSLVEENNKKPAVNFDDLKESIIQLAAELLEQPHLEAKVTALIGEIFSGKRLSECNEKDSDKFYFLRDRLEELR